MDPRTVLQQLAAAAKEQGKALAAKHGRPLGEALAARLSKAGVERGLLREPLNLDAVLARLQHLRSSGALDKEELRSLTRALREQCAKRCSDTFRKR